MRNQLEPVATKYTVPVMAAACGIMVANVYLCQPLLSAISESFRVTSGTAGYVAMGAQVGYALGILLVVPLADRVSPRRLLRTLLGLTCIALLLAAASPSASLLALSTLAVTTVTVVPQIIIPVAVSMAGTSQSGKVVGQMQTGLILGILLSRTVSGAVAQFSGTWRASYLAAALCTAALFFILPSFVPQGSPNKGERESYFSLLGSLPKLLWKWQGLRLSGLLGASVFGAFSAFWATLAFHLAAPPFGYGTAQAGLLGLWGAAGALIAPQCGKLVDRFGPERVNALAIGATALSFAFFLGAGSTTVWAIIVGVNFLDFGNQAGQIANQARIFKLDPSARARLNTVYMVFTFSGGALGAALGTTAWSYAGWRGVCLLGFGLVAVAAGLLLLSVVARRSQGRRNAGFP